MKVLGISTLNHDSSISLVEDGNILACYTEERFSRNKYDVESCPILGLESLQKDFDFNIEDDDVVVSAAIPVWKHDEFLKNILNIKKEVKVYGHHQSHAYGAYMTSGFKGKTLIITLDSTSSTNWFKDKITLKDIKDSSPQSLNSNFFSVYLGENNEIELVDEVKGAPNNPEGKYYNPINCLSTMWGRLIIWYGFNNKDEGKVMGLAPQGNLNINLYHDLKSFITWNTFDSTAFMAKMDLMKEDGWFEDDQMRKDLAYTWQRLSEDVMLDLVAHYQTQYPECENLCLAGGFFANVKANQKINEYLNFKEIYIMPPMGDDGLSIGAALLRANEIDKVVNKRWDNVFLGKGWSNNEIYPLIDQDKYIIKPLDPSYIAEQLVNGRLVGLFIGRAEYGPRALGHRTILCDPRNKKNHEYINRKLKRNEIMPFAPMIMAEHISEICYAHKSLRAAEFMTLCFTVKEHWAHRIPAVIQNDDATCRAQTVYKKRNPINWEILEEFRKLTDVPVLLNTSFNGHREPIINSPDHAIQKIEEDVVDVLVLNNMIIEKRVPTI
jgi:carbamoyltransferase